MGRRCGGTGGRYRASLGSGRRMPESREPALLPGFVCACFTGRGARACHPPGPRDPRPRRGTTPGTIARRVPPRPGLRLTRSLHRQHPDSSVCSFVCFKYIYILYIYKHPYLFGGSGGSSPRCQSRRCGAEGLKLPGEPDPGGELDRAGGGGEMMEGRREGNLGVPASFSVIPSGISQPGKWEEGAAAI